MDCKMSVVFLKELLQKYILLNRSKKINKDLSNYMNKLFWRKYFLIIQNYILNLFIN